jgi:SAM-dependent methyltransferase
MAMEEHPKWPQALITERNFWDGIAQEDHAILRVLADNAQVAPLIRKCLAHTPEVSLEVGVGPLGLGISGFLPEIRFRFALDPLPPALLKFSGELPITSSEKLRAYLRHEGSEVRYVVARGEEIPIRSESMDLVICRNVLDHASRPDSILREIHRVLKPNGTFFFEVDTFSVLGLMKWHSWTKHIHKNEVLVKSHPHRMYEASVIRALRSCGFRLEKLEGHTPTSNLIGHARDSIFLGMKCCP